MITAKISINNQHDIIMVGAVRIFPTAPLYPRKNRIACYHCGEVINGKIGGDYQFYLWFKYGDGLELMAKVIRDYIYFRKKKFIKHPQFNSYEIQESKFSSGKYHTLVGKYHNLDGPCKIGPDPFWAIAGKLFYTNEEFQKELSKYKISPDQNLKKIIDHINQNS